MSHSQVQHRKIFVGGLSLETESDSLKAFFEKYGAIEDAVVMKDPSTKRSRGFGFVVFADKECVQDCLDGKPHILDGREVSHPEGVRYALHPYMGYDWKWAEEEGAGSFNIVLLF